MRIILSVSVGLLFIGYYSIQLVPQPDLPAERVSYTPISIKTPCLDSSLDWTRFQFLRLQRATESQKAKTKPTLQKQKSQMGSPASSFKIAGILIDTLKPEKAKVYLVSNNDRDSWLSVGDPLPVPYSKWKVVSINTHSIVVQFESRIETIASNVCKKNLAN